MVDLVVDSRETNSGIPALLRREGVPFKLQELAAGDYRIGDIVLERKAAHDFYASILDGRLFSQVEAMCLQAPGHVYMIVEGALASATNGLHPKALPGAVSALSLIYGVQLVWTTNVQGTAHTIERLWKHASEGLGYEINLRVKKPKATQSPDGASAQYLVEGLPGVGAETARALLRHFGSARAVFAATDAQLRACPGIGPKSAAAIATALDQQPQTFRVTKGPQLL